MKNSTKWFLIIFGILMVIGIFGSLMMFAVFAGMSDSEVSFVSRFGDRIAVVELEGQILSSDDIVRQFKKFGDDHSVKAILFRIDSPGGGVVASQEIYDEVRKVRDRGKPVVVSMGSLAASGGYYVACGASEIVANPGTLTGSIGVIAEFLHYDSLMSKIGVGMNTIKSGKLKDAGNPFRPMTSEDRVYFQRLMDQVHEQFVNVVETERGLDHDTVLAYADGRVFTGAEALEMGLVDAVGTYEDAIQIAADRVGIRGKPVLVQEHRRGYSLLERLLGATKIADFLGVNEKVLNQPILQYRMAQGF